MRLGEDVGEGALASVCEEGEVVCEGAGEGGEAGDDLTRGACAEECGVGVSGVLW